MLSYLLAALLLSTAQAAAPVDVAREAEEASQEHCGDVAGRNVTIAADKLVLVGEVWGRVSAAWEEEGPLYLLFWRGVLAACLDQDEKATLDLEAFVAAAAGDATYAAQVRQARNRLKRATSGAVGAAPEVASGLVGLGLGLSALGGGSFALTAWQANVLEQEEAGYEAVWREGGDTTAAQAEGEGAALRANVLLGVGIGSAVLAGASLVAAAAVTDPAGNGPPVRVAPMGAGLVAVWRW